MNKEIYIYNFYPTKYGILETKMFPNKYYVGCYKETYNEINGKIEDYTPLDNSICNYVDTLDKSIDLLLKKTNSDISNLEKLYNLLNKI